MSVSLVTRSLGVMGIILGASVAAATAAPKTPPVLASVQPGLWEITREGGAVSRICMADPGALVQVRHAGVSCNRMVVASDKGAATVHYSCPGAGWGRTSLQIVSPRSIHIQTQGVADNAPFDEAADARRTGDCAAATQISRR